MNQASENLQIILDDFKRRYLSLKGESILLLYSGGLDTSFILNVFANEIGAHVYTLSFDLGEDPREKRRIADRACLLGARDHIHIDARVKFVSDFITPAIKANALYNGLHPISSSLTRPLMVQYSVDICKQLKCVGIAHGSCPLQNNNARFNNALAAIDPEIIAITPMMDNVIDRRLQLEYLGIRDLVISKFEDAECSSDWNLWSPEIEDGHLRDVAREASEDVYKLTYSEDAGLLEARYIDLEFYKGVPCKIAEYSAYGRPARVLPHLEGEEKPLLEIIEALNSIGGRYRIGRYDSLEERVSNETLSRRNLSNIKEREIHEGPAPAVILAAHKDLESTVIPDDVLREKLKADIDWTYWVVRGFWFDPRKQKCQDLIERVNESVCGTVRVRISSESVRVVARSSDYSLDTLSVMGRERQLVAQC